MGEKRIRHKQPGLLRTFRNIHRTTGALLFFFFIIVAVTGLLLGLKNHSGGMIKGTVVEGTSSNLEEWLPVDSLHRNACRILNDSISPALSPELDRIDIRKEKGVAKFIFKNHYWSIHLDGATGELLQIERRDADIIENIHDGSILDKYFTTGNEQIKVAYSTLMGLALLLFSVTGFWLWLGPKRMRSRKINGREKVLVNDNLYKQNIS